MIDSRDIGYAFIRNSCLALPVAWVRGVSSCQAEAEVAWLGALVHGAINDAMIDGRW